MGGNKPTAMQRHPALTWYAEKFEAVSKLNARLMVIGYGFRDAHINQMIYEGWEKGGKTLTMFIVQSDSREIVKKVNAKTTRPFQSTFGTDAAEHKILIDYAAGR
jgi:hypothetical protein